MPPRRRSGAAASTPDHLTADNLAALATAVAEGKRATVYLREATPSLGIEAGTSAKVVSVDGNTVMIRPKGVNDELPFEAEELRINRVSAAPAKPAPRPKPVVESEPLMEPLVEPVRTEAACAACTRSGTDYHCCPCRDTSSGRQACEETAGRHQRHHPCGRGQRLERDGHTGRQASGQSSSGRTRCGRASCPRVG